MRLLMVMTAGLALAHASDRVAVYARVDKVVLTPNSQAPETVQVWGVFSLAKPQDNNDYLAASRGYLYFRLPDNKDAARREWADLRQVAGTGQIVAFGNRWEQKARLRKADERAENADPYVVNVGVNKIRGNTDYAPVRALIDYRE